MRRTGAMNHVQDAPTDGERQLGAVGGGRGQITPFSDFIAIAAGGMFNISQLDAKDDWGVVNEW